MKYFALTFALFWGAATNTQATTIDGLNVAVVDEAVIVSVVEGRVAELAIEEGQVIAADDLVVRLDDQKQQLSLALARREVEIAETLSEQSHALDSAEATADTQKSRLDEHAVRMDQHQDQADNELKVLAAMKAEAVAKNEWTRAQAAQRKFADAVSQSEIEALRLDFERSQLETREAKFQQAMAQLDVKLDASTRATLTSQLRAANIEIEKAKSGQVIEKLEIELKRLRLRFAEVDLDERQVRSPIAGTVASLRVRPGEWVRPGDELARVIGLDRLRVEGYAAAELAAKLMSGEEVQIQVTGTRSRKYADANSATPDMVSRRAIKRFVSPEMDPVTGEVRFWIEFDNSDGLAQPGCRAAVVLGTP
ncbi:Multidrug resistance efflux pump [Neorhodopirellula lusitana]|uniref:Multidrug resistance efflux pump n=1 Tax=Neorhodopirellula lusitana TaxID=445327 RepID=A0ABY1QDJ5_9BACT|nr:HlyD family efflux transporter periplasmic adaptor subunit [Neorhodopirellula lusitana]SMP68254.1 Multidrug resistance efflux pump [Neorhodopirellula lusitana]